MELQPDIDPQETQEWLDALDSVLVNEGGERAHFLLEKLIESFEPATEIETAWVAEALRRRKDVQSGKVTLVSGDEAVSRLKDQLA